MKIITALIAAGAIGLFAAQPAHAIGCLTGGAAGAVAGHVAGHHAVLGAIGGCIAGRHLHNEQVRKRQEQMAHPAPDAGPATPQKTY